MLSLPDLEYADSVVPLSEDPGKQRDFLHRLNDNEVMFGKILTIRDVVGLDWLKARPCPFMGIE